MRRRTPIATPMRTLAALAAVFLLALAAWPARGQERCGSGFACESDPTWSFQDPSRRVKVVLLAGSIGAFQDRPYARLLYERCSNVEIRNLSRVGFGAQQLYGVFQREVLRNPHFPRAADGTEQWLVWNGGLNSAVVWARTNRFIRRTFVEAHARGMRVVGLSLTPWGAFDDDRWSGARALETHDSTQRIVDFVMGRGAPNALLGTYASDRRGAADAYTTEELADVRVDLYDSDMRDRGATPRDVDEMRRAIRRDGRWLAAVPEAERPARLESDAVRLSEMGRWFLRREYRGFDDVHPNREGHAHLAQLICPSLPASWGCRCP